MRLKRVSCRFRTTETQLRCVIDARSGANFHAYSIITLLASVDDEDVTTTITTTAVLVHRTTVREREKEGEGRSLVSEFRIMTGRHTTIKALIKRSQKGRRVQYRQSAYFFQCFVDLSTAVSNTASTCAAAQSRDSQKGQKHRH